MLSRRAPIFARIIHPTVQPQKGLESLIIQQAKQKPDRITRTTAETYKAALLNDSFFGAKKALFGRKTGVLPKLF